MYNKSKFRSVIGHNWPKADEFKYDPYKDYWNQMSNFEKLCWAWSKLNPFAIKVVEQNPNAKLFRFEDIFESENRYEYLKDLVEFVTTFQDGTKLEYKSLDGWLDKKVHSNGGGFPSCENWTKEQKDIFRRMCGPLMKELGYEVD